LRLEPIVDNEGGAQIVRHDFVWPELIASRNRTPDLACRDAHTQCLVMKFLDEPEQEK
jgi:hypothetical protein